MNKKIKVMVIIIVILILIATICVFINLKTRKTTQTVLSQTSAMDSMKIQEEKEEEIERIVVVLNKDANTLNKKQTKKKKETTEKEETKTDEKPQETETKEEPEVTTTEDTSNNYVPDTYYIKVNNEANVVNIYTYDDDGQYTVPVKSMICSTGRATPTDGNYSIKDRWEWLGLVGDVYGHYCTQINGNILFHSVPYLEKGNPASLEYWEYDKLRNSMLSRLCKVNC